MLQAKFVEHIKHPNSSLVELTNELNQIVEEYPFFASAHLLLTKALFKQNSIQYSKQLRKTALISNSRRILYDYLHKIDINEDKISQPVEVSIPISIDNQTIEEENTSSETSIKTSDFVSKPEKPSRVTVTNDEVKVIYITTVTEKSQDVNPLRNQEAVQEKVNHEPTEIELLQNIENTTQENVDQNVSETTVNPEINKEDSLNQQIENEIHKSIVQSYVEKEIIRTPELEKEESKEPVSFTDWLQKIKKESHTIQKVEIKPKTEEKEAETEPKEPKKFKKPSFLNQNMQIIDKIIESDPGRIKLTGSKFYSPSVDSKQSLIENEHLVTETLAKIYALQGNISKAIRAYEILSLKFPQKSVYFASLIEKLKTNK